MTTLPDTAKERSRTLTAATLVHSILRDEILSLRREPGSQLNEKELAAQNGVSRTPVREAILRLADEGLVDVVSKSGTYVSRIPLAALPEAIAIRCALEQMAVRAAVQHASKSQIIELDAIIARMGEFADGGDRERFHRADEAFHEAVAAAGRFPGVWTVVKQVKLQVDRFRRLTLPLEGRMARVVAEHTAVLEAVRRRDADAAAQAMGLHIDGLRFGMDDVARFSPDFFEEDLSRVDARR
ncbi:MAG: GntR family transcriptional regulator [Rhizobiaceae bacterium]|nr:GntR family transcriptional regulator [Rhizobiaceae bacterium]